MLFHAPPPGTGPLSRCGPYPRNRVGGRLARGEGAGRKRRRRTATVTVGELTAVALVLVATVKLKLELGVVAVNVTVTVVPAAMEGHSARIQRDSDARSAANGGRHAPGLEARAGDQGDSRIVNGVRAAPSRCRS